MRIRIHKAKYHHSQWYYYIKPKPLTLHEYPPIYKWLWFVISLNKEEYERLLYKRGQRTFIYCPKCDAELISIGIHLFQREDGIEVFRCRNCGTKSRWDFNYPTPICLKGADNIE